MSACYTPTQGISSGVVRRNAHLLAVGPANFLDWVIEYFDVRDDTLISITKRNAPLSYMPPPEPFQPEDRVAASSAASSEGPCKCRVGCKEFSKSIHRYVDVRKVRHSHED